MPHFAIDRMSYACRKSSVNPITPIHAVLLPTCPRYRSSFFDHGLHMALSILFVIDTGSTSCSSFLRPNTWPISPPGFGTGHSRCGDSLSSNCFLLRSSSLIESVLLSSSSTFRLRRFLFSPVGSAESANVRGSTGHGMRCGAATTRKDTMSVVVKSEVVMRDRGWRCGGMVYG